MACKKCGSDWVTQLGHDCVSCPLCCKQQRHKARKEGRWIEPTQQKACEECGAEFTAVGLQNIAIQVLCENPACKTARHKRKRRASAKKRLAGVYTLSRDPKPKRHCQFSGCNRQLTRREQKGYCGKPCYFAAIDAGEQQFRGRVQDEWARLVDWAYEWEAHRPRPRKPRPRKALPLCQHCGNECGHKGVRFCSYACNKAWRGPRACACGTIVYDATAFGKSPYCMSCKRESARIQRRMYGSYRKRCRTYGGHFNSSVKPIAVFVQDKWRCHICKKKTHKVFRVGDNLSATVDHHPIPLSKGGDHDWHNVRCACFGCNTRKGNKWNGQRRLALL